MIKRLAATIALGAVVALGVPSQDPLAQGVKKYSELTELQKDLFQTKAMVSIEPEFTKVLLEKQGAAVARTIPEYNAKDILVFAECYGAKFMDYYGNLDVMTYMVLTDDEITAAIGNEGFDAGVLCGFEVYKSRENIEHLEDFLKLPSYKPKKLRL